MSDLIIEELEANISSVIKIENFLVDLEKLIGEGQYGKVYIAEQLEDDLFSEQFQNIEFESSICACKIVDRKKLSSSKE